MDEFATLGKEEIMNNTLRVLAVSLWVALAASPVWGQADFYQGKTVTVLIGAKSGSLAIAAQIVAHHLGKYLPGKPTAIIQHMPGAAHLLAILYNK
jgi:hypothetical protein